MFSSSNIVYAAPTAYKVSKLAAEGYCEAYSHLYGLSTIALRYSNVYGSLRQNEENCIASMRASFLQDRADLADRRRRPDPGLHPRGRHLPGQPAGGADVT